MRYLMFGSSGGSLPQLLFMDTLFASNSGGEGGNGAYVNLYGKNFGATPVVTVGGVEVAAYKQRGVAAQYADAEQALEQITVQLGAGVSTGAVVVANGGLRSVESHTLTAISGDVRFVARDGNDGTAVLNDITHPWLNPYVALQASTPGDQVVLRAGTWNEDNINGNIFTVAVEGTAGNPIIVTGYPGETVLISGRPIKFSTSDGYVVLSNFSMDMLDSTSLAIAVKNPAVDVRLVGLQVANCQIDAGLAGAIDCGALGGVDAFKVLGTFINHAGGNGFNHGIYVNTSSSNIEIGWCKIYDVTFGNGIQIYDGSGAIPNVNVHDLIIDVSGKGGVTFGQTSTGELIVRDSTIIYRGTNGGIRANSTTGVANLTIDNCSVTCTNAAGVCLGTDIDDTLDALTITNCTINAQAGLMQNITTEVEKITSYGNTWIPGPDPAWETAPP